MTINTLYVTPAIGATAQRPKINLCAPWLFDMGFTPAALVQALPEPGGISFILRNENIWKYSELYTSTKEKGGALIIVTSGANMEITGKCIRNAGLDIGDSLIARYEYGYIGARKLPDKAKVIPAAKDKHTVRLTGKWMTELGFTLGAVVTASVNPGSVTFKLQERGIEDYCVLVKHARKNKEQLLQVHMEAYTQCLEVDGAFLERAEFDLSDAFIATYDYGIIHVTKLDFEQLGFW